MRLAVLARLVKPGCMALTNDRRNDPTWNYIYRRLRGWLFSKVDEAKKDPIICQVFVLWPHVPTAIAALVPSGLYLKSAQVTAIQRCDNNIEVRYALRRKRRDIAPRQKTRHHEMLSGSTR